MRAFLDELEFEVFDVVIIEVVWNFCRAVDDEANFVLCYEVVILSGRRGTCAVARLPKYSPSLIFVF